MHRYLPTVVLLILLLAARTAADEKPLSADAAAARAVQAFTTKDAASLRTLALRDTPDPWTVAELLCEQGRHDAALAFAKAAPRPAIERLPAYVASRRAKKPEPAAHRAVAELNAALVSGDAKRALQAAARIRGPLDSVARVRLEYGRGLALRALKRTEESGQAFSRAGAAAEKLGWLGRARSGFSEAGAAAIDAARWKRAVETMSSLLRVARRLQDKRATAVGLYWLGRANVRLGRSKEALSQFQEALVLHRTRKDRAAAAETLTQIAALHYHAERLEEALGYYGQALHIVRDLGDLRSVAGLLHDIGRASLDMGAFPRSKASYAECLEIAREVKDDDLASAALNGLGMALEKLGEYDSALLHHTEVLKRARAADDQQSTAKALNNIGIVHERRGSYEQALRFYRESLAISKALGLRAFTASTINNIGSVHRQRGSFAQALARFQESLRIAKAAQSRPDEAMALSNIAMVHEARGRYEDALDYYRRCLSIERDLENTSGIAYTLGNMGHAYDSMGMKAHALRHFERAVVLLRGIRDKAGVATAVNNLGTIHYSLGNRHLALQHYQEALQLEEELGRKPSLALVLTNIANIRSKQGNKREALAQHKRALDLLLAAGNRAESAAAMLNVGSAQLDLGDHQAALSSFRRALELSRQLRVPRDIAHCLAAVASAYQKQREDAKAVAAYDEALQFLKNAPDSRKRAGILGAKASIRYRQMRLMEAALLASQSVSSASATAQGLGEGEGPGARDTFADVFGIGIGASAQLGDPAMVTWFLEHARAGTLREAFEARSSLQAILPEELRKLLLAAQAEERTALRAYRSAYRNGEASELERARAAYGGAREKHQAIVLRIQREAKAQAALLYPGPETLETIQGYVQDDEALVYYGLTFSLAYAVVVRREGSRIIKLGPIGPLKEAFDALYDDATGSLDLRSPRVRPRVRPQRTPRVNMEPIQELRRLLIEPLGLGDVSRVLVSPTGWLGHAPFGLLVPELEIVYVPSGTMYGLLRKDRALRGARVLAVGDPDYQTLAHEAALALHRGTKGGRLSQLPGARVEAEAIGTTALTGRQATEARLRTALSKRARWRAVHLACHGLLDPSRPARCALVLAATDQDDGFLTSLEIMRMKIPADLVVLSACDTGKGKIYRTEGIDGLTRAFMFAGSPRVICSLWKVDDQATRALMEKFYALWSPSGAGEGKQGMSAAAALKQAQDHIRSQEKWKHPHYWAAWVLWGLP